LTTYLKEETELKKEIELKKKKKQTKSMLKKRYNNSVKKSYKRKERY